VEFYGESPRAVILLSAALTELAALEAVPKHELRPDEETDGLFDFEAPLGTFSGKIELYFAVRLMWR